MINKNIAGLVGWVFFFELLWLTIFHPKIAVVIPSIYIIPFSIVIISWGIGIVIVSILYSMKGK